MWRKLTKKIRYIFERLIKFIFKIHRTFKSLCKKLHSVIMCLFFYFTPVFSLFVTFNFAMLYFENSASKIETILHGMLILFQIGFILIYCHELVDINKNSYTTRKRTKLFIFIFIHIIQLFANIHLLLLTINNESLSNLTAETPWQLCFDITYFSAMTFIGGDAVISPATRLAQLIVLIESLIFAVYISIIIFNIFTHEEQKENIS